MSWRDEAACLGKPTEWFVNGQPGSDYTAARAVCATCPVAIECAGFAVSTRTNIGVFGGMSHDERKAWAKSS